MILIAFAVAHRLRDGGKNITGESARLIPDLSVAAVVADFFPPAGLPEATAVSHTLILIVAVLAGVLFPLAISHIFRPRTDKLAPMA